MQKTALRWEVYEIFEKGVDEKEKYAIILFVHVCAQKYTQSVVLLEGTEGRLGVVLCQM